MNIREIAQREIPPALNSKVLIHKEGETRDIIKEVLTCFNDSRDQLTSFAPYLKGRNVKETCRNIWEFWKNNIRYEVDPEGKQFIKTPSAVWATKFCDCKSFSVAVASTLSALGIPGKFRFTSYGTNSLQPTHVYVVATPRDEEIIIDCVWTGFNSQKPFTKNWDYNMTAIYRISGTEAAVTTMRRKGVLDIDVNDHSLTEAELELALGKQRLELEQQIYRKKGGRIGDHTDNAYQVEIESHVAAIGSIGLFKKKKAAAAPGTPKVSKKLAKALKKNDGKGVSKKQAKLLEKAGVAVKKRKEGLLKRVAKGITKVIKTPVRLAAKTQLPKNAPFFLYLFLDSSNQALMAKLPDVVREKQAHAQKYKGILVDKLQMKESNFTSIIRNGIMSQFGQSPEEVLAAWMKDWKTRNGIGILPLLAAAGGGLKLLLGKLGENFAAEVEQYTPAAEDWGNVSAEAAQQMAQTVQNSPYNNDPSTGNGSVRVYNSEGDYAVKNGSGTYVPVDADGDGIPDNLFTGAEGAGIPPVPEVETKSDNSLAWLAAGGAALLLL